MVLLPIFICRPIDFEMKVLYRVTRSEESINVEKTNVRHEPNDCSYAYKHTL